MPARRLLSIIAWHRCVSRRTAAAELSRAAEAAAAVTASAAEAAEISPDDYVMSRQQRHAAAGWARSRLTPPMVSPRAPATDAVTVSPEIAPPPATRYAR